MLKTIVHVILILSAFLAFTEFIGERRLHRFEKLVRQHITLQGFFLLPFRLFRSVLNCERVAENIVGCFSLLLVLIILVDQPFLKSLQEIVFNFYFLPIISIGDIFGNFSDFLAGYSQILANLVFFVGVIFSAIFTSLYGIYISLLVFTFVAVIFLYPLLFFLSIGNWLKHRFKLKGSFLKISAAVIELLAAIVSIFID